MYTYYSQLYYRFKLKLLSGLCGSLFCMIPFLALDSRPYLEAVFKALDCSINDYKALFSLCLLYALGHNNGKSI